MFGSNRMTAVFVDKAKLPGVYHDGGGLYLQVAHGAKGIGKSWIFRYSHVKKAKAMGLGPYPAISLAEARKYRDDKKAVLAHGLDPIIERDRERQAAATPQAPTRVMTFDDCAGAYIASHEVKWANAKHSSQWQTTIATYASPVIGGQPVDEIDIAAVMRVLNPIWRKKPETASRLRGRVEAILGWAGVMGYRSGENPARWKSNLDQLLPAKNSIRSVVHHAALPYTETAAFMAALRQDSSFASRALQFTILTAARTGEVIGAQWSEIDLERRLWTVPASRMKSGRDHRVPLNEAAIAVLTDLPVIRSDARVFPISGMAMAMLLRRTGRGEITVHGFRSSFKDWASDMTGFQNEVVEAALAHSTGDKMEQAYRRGDALEKRRGLMDAWANYCAGQAVAPTREGYHIDTVSNAVSKTG